METYSVTYIGVLVVLLASLLQLLGVKVGTQELTTFVMTAVQIGGALLVAFRRHQQGDINILGVKK